jgi:hypothetical protein
MRLQSATLLLPASVLSSLRDTERTTERPDGRSPGARMGKKALLHVSEGSDSDARTMIPTHFSSGVRLLTVAQNASASRERSGVEDLFSSSLGPCIHTRSQGGFCEFLSGCTILARK